MKFSIERAALLKAVSQAQSVVERRNTIPILANVLIEAEGNEVSFWTSKLSTKPTRLLNALVLLPLRQPPCTKSYANFPMVRWFP